MKTRIILMLIVVAAVATAAKADIPWDWDADNFTGGWNAVWNSPMSWDVYDDDPVPLGSGGAWAWWAGSLPVGVGVSAETMKWNTRVKVAPPHSTGNRYEYMPAADATKWGVEFIDPAWSGKPNTAVIAAYIGQDQLFMQHDWGYQFYRPELYAWENKPYFKTDARIAAVNADGAVMRLKSYAYAPGGGWDTAAKTLIGYTDIALGEDYVWQEVHRNAVAKPAANMLPYGVAIDSWLLFEVEVLGGSADTRLYIDELRFVSDVDTTGLGYGAPGWVLPEPATMLILALGGLMLRRNRK